MPNSKEVNDKTLSFEMCDMNVKKGSSCEKTKRESGEKKPFSLSTKRFFRMRYEAFKKSKVPTYFCILLWVLLCLLGNVITGIILCKHHFIFEETRHADIITHSTLTQVESKENQSTTSDSVLVIENEEEVKIDQQLLYLNASKYVSKLIELI